MLDSITFRNSIFLDEKGTEMGFVDSDGDFRPAEGFESLEDPMTIEGLRAQAHEIVTNHNGDDDDFEQCLINWTTI